MFSPTEHSRRYSASRSALSTTRDESVARLFLAGVGGDKLTQAEFVPSVA